MNKSLRLLFFCELSIQWKYRPLRLVLVTFLFSLSVQFTQAQCANYGTGPTQDFDCDGVINSIDIDDDNDGVLDEIECRSGKLNTKESNGTFGTLAVPRDYDNTLPGGGYKYTTTNSAATQYAIINKTYDWFGRGASAGFWLYAGHTTGANNDAFLAVNGGTTIGDFYSETLKLIKGTKYKISFWHQKASVIDNFYELAAQLVATNGTILANVSTGVRNSLGWSETTIEYTSNVNQTVVFRLRNLSTNSAGNDFSIDDISLTVSGCPDTDGDGFPNYMDTDSDGDGCSDAVEAGAVTNLTTTTVAGPYGANGFANSLETVAESGVYIGTYTYSYATDPSINFCLDSDGDGAALS